MGQIKLWLLILFFTSVFYFLAFDACGNNIRVTGKTKVVEFIGSDTAVIEVNLSWENSWRDDFNWDAAWIFFKYKKRGTQEPWEHAYLTRVGHEALSSDGQGYTFMFGEVGQNVAGLVCRYRRRGNMLGTRREG